MRIGFAGVGLMGQGMVENLLESGHEVAVLGHRNREPIEAVLAAGATEVANARELAANRDVIGLCLPNSRVVEAVIEEMLPVLREGMIVIDHSTADPASTRRLQERLAQRGIGFIDAPVAGGPGESRAGKLGALVGGAEADVDKARPILACFCREISHFGGPGAGNVAKLINNYMVLGIVAVSTEAFRLAREASIDWTRLYNVMLCGSGNSAALRRMMEPALAGDFDGYPFSIGNAAKDATYALELFRSMQCTTSLAEAVADVYVHAAAKGDPERFVSQLLAEKIDRDQASETQ